MAEGGYTAEQLAWIFRREPSREEKFERHLTNCALDFLTHAIAAKTSSEKLAYTRAYVLLNNGLIEADIWPRT